MSPEKVQADVLNPLQPSLAPDDKLEYTRSDPSDSKASKLAGPVASTSGARSKETKTNKKETRKEVGGWYFVPGNKRGLQLSPEKPGIETHNRFEALDPASQLKTSRPTKKMAISTSCCDLSIREDLQLPRPTPMEGSLPTGDQPDISCICIGCCL